MTGGGTGEEGGRAASDERGCREGTHAVETAEVHFTGCRISRSPSCHIFLGKVRQKVGDTYWHSLMGVLCFLTCYTQMKCHSLCLFSLVIYRKVKDMDGQLSLMHQKLEVTKAQCDKKEAECVEKDSQVLSCPERYYFPFVQLQGDSFSGTYTTEFVLHSLPYQSHEGSKFLDDCHADQCPEGTN